MKRGLFSGTFDPPSLGHLDLIYRAKEICDELYIAIPRIPSHRVATFSAEERKNMLEKVTQKIPDVSVHIYDGLPFKFADEHNVDCFIRGLRTSTDFDYEFRLSLVNKLMVGMETLFLIASDKYSHISNSLIREIVRSGWRLRDFVPEEIEADVYEKFKKEYNLVDAVNLSSN